MQCFHNEDFLTLTWHKMFGDIKLKQTEQDSPTLNREIYKYSHKVALVIHSPIDQVIHDIKCVNVPAFAKISFVNIKIGLC